MLSVGCFSKPDFTGSAPRPDASIDGAPLPQSAWRELPNLLTYLPLDESAGVTKVMDQSDAMNNGTTFGATVVGSEGKIGTAASFPDSSNARIELDSQTAFDDLSALTVCAWIWLDRLPTAIELSSNIVDKSSNGFDDGWNMYVEVAQGPRLGFLTPYGHYVAGQPSVATNVWTHRCVSWNGSDRSDGITLYQDGVIDQIGYSASLNHPTRQSDVAQPIALGRSAKEIKYSLFGKIDEFFLFNAVLTPEAIWSLYECAP